MLHVSVHQVPQAKFYVIDVHNHINDAAGIDEHMAPQRVIEVMDRTNVKTVVILTGMWGDKLQHVIDEMVKPYPGRFIVFTQLDYSKIDDPDFGDEMVRQIDDAVARGARGLKFLKDLGLGVRDKTGKLIAIDDPRLDPVWHECGRLGIPVSIHTGDPEAFFLPTDGKNERYEELTEHPDWSFYGPQFPSLEQLLEARNRVFARHPETQFVSLHMGWPENLDWVSRMIDEHPNVMVEFGAREAELGRQPRRTRELFLKYQDRVMFGTDNGMDEAMYSNHFRWLETGDESFDYWGDPAQGRWEIYGLELPDSVLEKIYHLNAERMFPAVQGRAGRKPMKGERTKVASISETRGPGVPRLRSLARDPCCTRPPAKTEPALRPSTIKVEVKPGGPVVLTTSSAEFQILPSGYIQASLLKGGQKLTLDEPGAGASSDFLVQDGKEVQFALDFGQTKVSESTGKLGRGKRVEIPAHASDPAAAHIERTLQIEVYDDFPDLLLSSAEYKNTGPEDFHVDRVVEQQHTFSAAWRTRKPSPTTCGVFTDRATNGARMTS